MTGYNFLVKGKSFAIFTYGGGTYHSHLYLRELDRGVMTPMMLVVVASWFNFC